MSEGKKTGIFWIAAALMMGVGALVSWQPMSKQQSGQTMVNTALFEKFTDPLAAASLKVVTFDEEQGALETFEVRKDRETGAWTIPSRDGYPADAVEQMKNAGNSLVDLKILDTIAAEPGDHEKFGVVEPNLEDLDVGDEGVGRLVTFKDADQKTLASLILGDPVKDEAGQLYVRKPNQDPVYVVALDDKPLTTKFQDWIESDLLKLSSIDIEEMQIKDYNATVNPLSGQIALTRNYDADVTLDGSTWKLDSLKEYDPKKPLAEPKIVEVGEDKKLNSTKLNEIKNALDEVKIADVVRKPEGMSANLKADKELVSDQKAVQSLFSNGFYPVQMGPGGETEILSANGELVVDLKDGVEYVLRFGNISGLSEDDESADSAASEDEDKQAASGGVNRYLLVTARVNEAKFPAPELKPIPQKVEDLEGFGNSQEEPEAAAPAADKGKGKAAEPAAAEAPKKQPPSETAAEKKADEPAVTEKADAEKVDAEKVDSEKPAESKDEKAEDASKASGEDAAASAANEPATSGETEVSGSGSGGGSGQGQDPEEQAEPPQQDTKEQAPAEKSQDSEASPKADDAKQDEAKPENAEQPKEQAPAKTEAADDSTSADQPADAEAKSANKETAPESKLAEMSDEEKQELLEAEQEKITKENQRKLDERKDKLEAARKRVRELTARFADWYYVIPEDTYAKLRIKREELFEDQTAEKAAAPPGLESPGFAPPELNLSTPE